MQLRALRAAFDDQGWRLDIAPVSCKEGQHSLGNDGPFLQGLNQPSCIHAASSRAECTSHSRHSSLQLDSTVHAKRAIELHACLCSSPAGMTVSGGTTAPAATMAPFCTRAPCITVAPMPIRASSSMVHPCRATLWPTVTLSPTIVSQALSLWTLLGRDVVMVVPSCRLLPAPTVILPSSPAWGRAQLLVRLSCCRLLLSAGVNDDLAQVSGGGEVAGLEAILGRQGCCAPSCNSAAGHGHVERMCQADMTDACTRGNSIVELGGHAWGAALAPLHFNCSAAEHQGAARVV